MRPAKPRSAFTAQLPQFGQAMDRPIPLECEPMVPLLEYSTLALAVEWMLMVATGRTGSASGFPSPAEDYEEGRIDLNRELIPSPLSTFFMRVHGDAMRGDGICHGDLLMVDRSLDPLAGCVVVAVFEGRFIVRLLCGSPDSRQDLRLEASDGESLPIPIDDQGCGADVWGVVVHAVHHLAGQIRSRPGQTPFRRQEAGRRGP
ncbi:MAG: LexA family protein [Cyanobacteriota bacterium]